MKRSVIFLLAMILVIILVMNIVNREFRMFDKEKELQA